MSVAESKIPCVSQQVFEVLLPPAQRVLVPTPAQHQGCGGATAEPVPAEGGFAGKGKALRPSAKTC